MRRPLLLLALAPLMVTAAGNAARGRHDRYPLHPGSAGPRVAALQWLLAGHRPSVYTKTAPTFKRKPNGVYGARTKAAVLAMKYRIGYPLKGQCGARTSTVTDTAALPLFQLLEGERPRSTCWVGLAAQRVKTVVVAGATRQALKVKQLELSQLGVHEIPDGSNRGPRISYASGGYGPYQGSTGAYGEPWCASFGDWALKRIVGHGFGSANDAYVPTIAEYAQQHGWLQAKPRVGAFVVFLTAAGQLGSAYHIGYVIRLVGSSGVMTVEGNADNAVREVYRTFNSYHMVYVYLPGLA